MDLRTIQAVSIECKGRNDMGWRDIFGLNSDGTQAAAPLPEAKARAERVLTAFREKLPEELRSQVAGAIFKPANTELDGLDSYCITTDARFSRRNLTSLGLTQIEVEPGIPVDVRGGDYIRRGTVMATDFIVKADRLEEVLGIQTPARALS